MSIALRKRHVLGEASLDREAYSPTKTPIAAAAPGWKSTTSLWNTARVSMS